MNKTAKWVTLGAAALLLWPQKIESHSVTAEGEPTSTQTDVRGLLYKLSVRSVNGKREVTLSLLSDGVASGKIREGIASRKRKRQEMQHQPLFRSALDFVSRHTVTDPKALAKKLRVGVGCGEAFLETMEEMGIVERRDDGKFHVVLPKKMIGAMI